MSQNGMVWVETTGYHLMYTMTISTITTWVIMAICNKSDSLSFELGVTEVDSKVVNCGIFVLKSSFKTNFISF